MTSDGDVLLASTDTNNVISENGKVKDILRLQSGNTTLILKDVHYSDQEGYYLTDFSQKRDSGAVYKAAGIYGPYYSEDITKNIDFKAIFLEDKDGPLSKLKQSRSTYIILFYIAYLVLMYFFVLKPIKELTRGSNSKFNVTQLHIIEKGKDDNNKDEISAFRKIE